MVRPLSALLFLGVIALAPGSRVVTINPDSNSISVLDAPSRTKVAEIPVCTTPQTVAIDGSRAFVVCRDGLLNEVDLDAKRVTRAVAVGFDPFGVVVSGGRVYVSVTGEAKVLVLDVTTLSAVASVATEEYPRGLAVSGGKLYVTHFRSGKLSVIDTASMAVTKVIFNGLDANVSQSVVISGKKAYLPQTRSNATNPALVFDQTVFPIVSVVDLQTEVNLSADRFSIDISDAPVNTPIDVAVTTALGRILIVNAGSDDVSILDAERHFRIAHLPVGKNPRGIVVSNDERFAYVNNTLDGTVSVIDLASNTVVDTIKATAIPLDPSILNGKILFNTSSRADIARDRWISCASCHFDGGTDGRTWQFRDGPRNTPPLFGIAETLPMHWSGDLDELQDVESTIRNIQAGSGLALGAGNCDPACDTAPPNAGRSKDLDDLAAFMRTLRPAPRTITMSESALRGRDLFNDARTGCASCHVPPLYTDRKKHDVGTAVSPFEQKGKSFDTPSLRGLADSAPYFHDGTAATLLDAVRRHGNPSASTDSEKSDLVEFLRTIGFDSAPPRRRSISR